MPEHIVVADEYGGTRADAGLAGLLGISRSLAASLLAEGHVESKGKPLGKSAKLVAGDVLQVSMPERRDPLEVVEEVVEGLKILLDRGGWDRQWSEASPGPATASPPPGRLSAPASCTGSTSEPRV
jgi:hypothetical protein